MRPSLLRMMTSQKIRISSLPLPPTSQILQHNLTPDPLTPAKTFSEILLSSPSIQRRARIVPSQTHFFHLTPLPLPFPYRIAPEEGEEIKDQAAYVEQWLSSYEAHERVLSKSSSNAESSSLKKYASKKRNMPRELIGISDTGLKDCLPHLAVGDAFVHIGSPTLANSDEDEPQRPVSGENTAIREELVDILSGHTVMMSLNVENTYVPWSLRYSGHQFGVWAGQLGDGRAISILETPHPSNSELTYELQLKGAGRTPYSRSADGLAVLRSSIREFLCSEAMHALHIPTSRSLALIHLPKLEVIREEVESACVLTRMAPSFIRIGSFEALNPPQSMYFFGGGQQPANYEALRKLGEWVVTKVLKLNVRSGEPWSKALVLEVARRNARMVAGWQAYGFMHGVINTDNISILGLTIDYGPYAFMDIFDPFHICNHTDAEGRYAYQYQPDMIAYAVRSLLNALAPLMGAELETGKAVSEGWAEGVDEDKLLAWKKKGLEFEAEMKLELEDVYSTDYWNLILKRLALKTRQPKDDSNFLLPVLDLMKRHKLDFHWTFRRLCYFRPSFMDESRSEDLQKILSSILSTSDSVDAEVASKEWLAWLDKYAARIKSEENEWEGGLDAREIAARNANPRFVLRQWVLEEIIKRVQTDTKSGRRALAKVHEMVTHPYESWGAENDECPDNMLDPEAREERRYCGLGSRRMLGFQCSCSS